MNYESELNVALEAAKTAGKIISDGYGASYAADKKGIGDLVCDVDREADRVILGALRSHFPNDEVLSEELSPDTEAGEDRLWIVDPLDGTAGFLYHAGKGIPAVLIALTEGGRTQVAVVHIPLTDETFYAVRGEGAYKNGKRLGSIKTPADLSEAWVEMNHYGDVKYETEGFRKLRDRLRSPGGASVVTVGMPHSASAMRVLEAETDVAAVIHDNNPAKVKQAAWDISAPQLVLEEAGGGFWNMRGERCDPFAAEPFVVAGSEELAGQVIRLWKS